jgi:hypothetical protein
MFTQSGPLLMSAAARIGRKIALNEFPDRGEVATRSAGGANLGVRASDTVPSTLNDIGVSRQRLSEWREIRDAGPEVVEEAIQNALSEGRAPTVRGLQALMMQALERGTPLTADELMKVQGHTPRCRRRRHDARTGEAHDKPVAVLRPRPVRKLVALLRSLSVRERTTILAQAMHEGTMTRVEADQVLFAIAFDGNNR